METIFALTTGRSGTRFLSSLFRGNAQHAICRHEPYVTAKNHSMFGRPILWNLLGESEKIHRRLEQKQRAIQKINKRIYIETSHAFLKSYYPFAMEYFPNSRFVHLSRHPLKTARSEANRELKLNQVRFPFRNYRGDDGRSYFRWSLTGKEPIFRHFDEVPISLFQKYLIQWIEIENRAMRFIHSNGLEDQVVHLHSPRDLNCPLKMKWVFRSLEVPMSNSEICIKGKQNRTPGAKTMLLEQEFSEFRSVVEKLPVDYLQIFQHPPYSRYEWASLFATSAEMPSSRAA